MLYDTELECAEDTFSILMILALLYDHTGKNPAPHTIFDADYMPEIYLEALEYVAEECERSEDQFYDIFVKYQFPGMCEYYALCREHSRKNGIAFKNDPYVKEAERTVYEALQSINSYCFDWRLFTPVKETEKNTLACCSSLHRSSGVLPTMSRRSSGSVSSTRRALTV